MIATRLFGDGESSCTWHDTARNKVRPMAQLMLFNVFQGVQPASSYSTPTMSCPVIGYALTDKRTSITPHRLRRLSPRICQWVVVGMRTSNSIAPPDDFDRVLFEDGA